MSYLGCTHLTKEEADTWLNKFSPVITGVSKEEFIEFCDISFWCKKCSKRKTNDILEPFFKTLSKIQVSKLDQLCKLKGI